ncbi:MAG: PQQ-binding-like beta-propeller repeat protein [Thermoanaerobaculia bacterium]
MIIRSISNRLLLFHLACSLGASPAVAENWPHWRGPRFDGTSTETGLPTIWSGDQNVRWRLPLPGPAGSTPVVWGDRLYLTSTHKDGDSLHVLAVSRDGELAWQREVDRGTQKVFPSLASETTLASPSPVTDGEHLWVLFGTAKVMAIDRGGKEIWKRDLAADYGQPKTYFGLSSSLLLDDGKLYVQMLHTDRQLVLALDPQTGKELWVHDRKTDARDECLHSYASPTLFRAGEEKLLLIHGADYLTAHRPSDGAEAWRHGGLNPEDSYNPSFRLVATPVVADGLVVLPTAKRGPVYGLRPAGAKGDITGSESHTAWHMERGTPDVPSPLVHDGLVYLNGEKGTLTVLDTGSGEELYAERVHQSNHRGSPVYADGKIYLTGTDGTVSVVRAGRTFELLAKNTVDGYLASSPAISDGTIYLRSYEALFAIAESSGE